MKLPARFKLLLSISGISLALTGCPSDDIKPTIVSFTASPMTVEAGQTTTLSWSVQDADTITIAAVPGGSLVTNGTELMGTVDSAAITADTTFTIFATSGENMVSQTVTVTVNVTGGPTIDVFSAAPMTIDPGASSTLTWQTTGADTVVIADSGGTEVVSGTNGAGTVEVTPVATETYTLTAANADGMNTAMVTVTVNQPNGASIVSWTANPLVVAPGQTSTLTWSVLDAPGGIEISDGAATLHTSPDLTGTFVVSPAADTTYTLRAINPEGDANRDVTVTINAAVPAITTFEATPNPTALDGMTTLSWVTANAASISISRGLVEIYNTTTDLDSGSLAVTQTVTSTTYTIVATNPEGSNNGTITVTVVAAPAINVFTADPQTFQGATVTATVTWDVSDVSQLTLNANGQAVAGFPAVDNGTAVTNETGTFSLQVTETTTFELFAVNISGQTTATQLIATIVAEIEPNDTGPQAQQLPGDGSGVVGMIELLKEEDVDVYSVVVPAGANISAATSDGQGGCNFDTILTLYGAPDLATPIAINDDGGIAPCSEIDPRFDGGAADLAAGTYYIAVTGFQGATGDYTLTVSVNAGVCGNQIREASLGEECDDGGLVAGDGCDATCQFEVTGSYSAPGPNATFTDAIQINGAIDYFEVTVTQTAYLSVETFEDVGLGTCDTIDPLIVLLDSNGDGIVGNDDGGVDLCAILNRTNNPEMRLEVGTYGIVVLSAIGGGLTTYDIVFQSQPADICGDGIVEAAANEECDDGNVIDNDGCSSQCQTDVPITLEIEPNNNETEAATNGPFLTAEGIATLTASIAPIADRDYFEVTVPAVDGLNLRAQTYGTLGDLNTCNPGDTFMRLFDDQGAQIASNDDGGQGLCSLIEIENIAAGTYYIAVEELGNNAAIASYLLDLELAFPPATAEVEPNDAINTATPIGLTLGSTVTAQAAISPATDHDFFEIIIPRFGAVLTARTHNDRGNPRSGCGFAFDTRMWLRDAAGAQIAFNDDAGNSTCSTIANVDLAPGTYYLEVDEFDNDDLIASYFLDVLVVNRATVAETEPNNDVAGAITVGSLLTGPEGVTLQAALSPAGDHDFFEIVIPAGGGDLYAETFTDRDTGACVGDTELWLRDGAGAQVAYNDDGGQVRCSLLDLTAVPAGTYYLDVGEFGDNGEIPNYYLGVSLP